MRKGREAIDRRGISMCTRVVLTILFQNEITLSFKKNDFNFNSYIFSDNFGDIKVPFWVFFFVINGQMIKSKNISSSISI